MGVMVRSNLPESWNITFMVVILWVLNSKVNMMFPNQHRALYPDVQHWKELIDFSDKNGGPKEPDILTSMIKRTFK